MINSDVEAAGFRVRPDFVHEIKMLDRATTMAPPRLATVRRAQRPADRQCIRPGQAAGGVSAGYYCLTLATITESPSPSAVPTPLPGYRDQPGHGSLQAVEEGVQLVGPVLHVRRQRRLEAEPVAAVLRLGEIAGDLGLLACSGIRDGTRCDLSSPAT